MHKVAEVQEEASRAIVTLSLVSPKNKDLLHKHGASRCVIQALRQFNKNSVVQQEASNAYLKRVNSGSSPTRQKSVSVFE